MHFTLGATGCLEAAIWRASLQDSLSQCHACELPRIHQASLFDDKKGGWPQMHYGASDVASSPVHYPANVLFTDSVAQGPKLKQLEPLWRSAQCDGGFSQDP